MLSLSLLALFLALASAASPTPYRLLPPPLSTPWTNKVGTSPWPDHPRPLLRREAWQTLNGIWTYQPSAGAEAVGETTSTPPLPLAQEVLVPSCIESGISGVMVMGVTHMWFGRNFTVPKGWAEGGKRVLMHFEAVDYEATVFVNGAWVGFNRGGYARFSVDVTEKLVGGENEVHVFVFDPTDDQRIPQGKQVRRQSHIFYTPCTGIWQTVWLESVPETYITGLDVTADMHGNLDITVHTNTNQSSPIAVALHSPSGAPTPLLTALSNHPTRHTLTAPHLWTPSTPTLYNLTITLGTDQVTSYTAFRTISQGPLHGIPRPLLNNEPIFLFGPLDQGFWPDGIYTPPTVDAMVSDLELIKSLGMNTVRKHIKIEPDLFYAACDRLGLLVLQDMPSMRRSWDDGARPSGAEQAEFERQLGLMVEEHRNYPSIAAWVLYNEGWGQGPDAPEIGLTEKVRAMDRTRLVLAVTGWNDHGAGDFHDNHHYAEAQCGTPWSSLPSTPYDGRRIAVQGEFGGIGLRPADENLWPLPDAVATINQTYELHNAGPASYHYRAHQLLTQLRDQVVRYACSGAIYTQTSDVEGEVNGLVTYDRRVVRVDKEGWKRDVAALYEAARARA